MTNSPSYDIRPPRNSEFEQWFALYEPYSHIVESPVNRGIAAGVWGWILDPAHAVKAIVAQRAGKLVGFAHYRPFPRTLDANEACFLDDIYVADSERGTGLARQLIGRIVEISRERGWTHVRWVTTRENRRARALYEKVATLTDLLTYRIDCEELG